LNPFTCIKKLIAALLFMVSTASLANAQMSAGVPVFVDITLESGAVTVPSFSSGTDLASGLETSAVRFKVKANDDWKVITEIGTIISTPVPNGPSTILNPLTYNNFKYSLSEQNEVYQTAIAFSSTLATIITGGKTGQDKKFSIKFRITPGFSVDPAAYTIPITYTISPL
jgi:hypothetical protein